MKLKVSRCVYQRARQTDLQIFARNVVLLTHADATYAFLQSETAALANTLTYFDAALAASLNRGRIEVAIKNKALKMVVQALDKVSNALDAQVTDDAVLILAAGFQLRQAPTKFKGYISIPQVVRVASTGRKGTLRIQLKDEAPGMVVMHAVEYSVDRGQSWNNGIYNTHNAFVVQNLPGAMDLWLRFKSLGSGGAASKWSEPVIAAVL